MDIKAYIESGILESYALGLCDEREALEVESLCAAHPELAAELEAIRESLNAYAALHAQKPAPVVKERIFSDIDRLENPVEDLPGDQKIVRLHTQYRWLVAACMGLFALSLIGNIIIYNKWRSASDEVLALNQEKQVLADNMKSNQVKLETMSNDMAVLSNPDFSPVTMKGIETKAPGSLAMIYWNKGSGEVYLGVKQMPKPQPGTQYQLWAIVDGKPVDAGMVSMNDTDTSLHRMKDFASAQAFAITLEKEGGSPTPTLEQMYVMGAVSL